MENEKISLKRLVLVAYEFMNVNFASKFHCRDCSVRRRNASSVLLFVTKIPKIVMLHYTSNEYFTVYHSSNYQLMCEVPQCTSTSVFLIISHSALVYLEFVHLAPCHCSSLRLTKPSHGSPLRLL